MTLAASAPYFLILGFLVVAVASALVLLDWRRRESARYAARLAGVRSALIKLQYRPEDPSGASAIMASVADGAWLLSGDWATKQDVARRSLGFGLSRIATPAGQQVLEQVYRPLCKARACDPLDLTQQVGSTIRHPSFDQGIYQLLVSYLRSLPRFGPTRADSSQELIQQVFSLVSEFPADGRIHELVFALLSAASPISREHSTWFYQKVLHLLQAQPGVSALSVLALRVGRWHCGNSRPDGNVTLYDEQMIQNDISVRGG